MFLTLLQSGGAGPGVITGNLSAVESGADTLAAEGVVRVSGALSAAETGSDTFAATGTTLGAITGTLAATESGSDTFAATGKVIVRGTLAALETGSDTAAATGKVVVKGALAATESGADTFAGTGTVTSSAVQGDLAATEAGSDTFSASGTSGKPFGPPDWEYRPNTGGGPIGSMGPFAVQRKRRRPLPVDQQQEDAQEAADPWSQQFREIALADDAEISEFVFCLVSSGVLDGHV